MIESITDICNKYNSTNKNEVAKTYSVFHCRIEHVNILKEHITKHEQYILEKLKKREKDFPIDAFELIKEITSEDIAIARTYIESYILMIFSLTDILALLLFKILGFSANPEYLYFHHLITSNEINLKQYNNELIFDAAEALYLSDEYRYFHALNNIIKHRSVISTSHTLKLVEIRNYFSIQEFEYKGQPYPKVSTEELFAKAEQFINGLQNCITALE